MTANLAAAVLGVLTGVVSARALGPDGRGELALLILWPSLIAAVADLGIADAITLRTAASPDATSTHIRGGLWIALTASCVGVIVGFAATPFLLRPEQQQLRADAYWSLLYIPLSLLANVPLGALMGLQRFRAVAAVRIATAASYGVAMLAVVAAGYGSVRTLMWLTVAARGAPFVLAFPVVAAALSSRVTRKVHLFDQLSDGAHQHMAKLATVVSGAEDRALAGLRMSMTSIGQWQIASSLSVVMPFISQALAQQLYATVATGRANQAAVTRRAYLRTILLTGAAVVLAAPLLPVVIPLVYGDDFVPAVAPAAIVMSATIFGGAAMTLSASARAARRTRVPLASEIAGIAMMGATGWVFARTHGGIGLAVSYLVGRVTATLVLVLASTSVGLRPRDLLPLPRDLAAAARDEWREMRGSTESK